MGQTALAAISELERDRQEGLVVQSSLQFLTQAKCDPRQCLAGAAGFEPANAGTKNRCLTTWRRPSRRLAARSRAAAERRLIATENVLKRGSGALRADWANFTGFVVGVELFDRNRPAKQIALQLVASELTHRFGLAVRFDAFRRRFHA